MNSDCNHKNQLQRSGVNQMNRVLQALLPNHAKLDERDYADLILFAKNYGSQLKFFNLANNEDGDWQALMGMDVSVTLATLIKLRVQDCFAFVKNTFDTIKATDTSAEPALRQQFKVLFDVGFSITTLLNEYYHALPDGFAFKTVMGSLVKSQLQPYYDRLKKYYDEAVAQGIVDSTATFIPEASPVRLTLSQDFEEAPLNKIWFDSMPSVFAPTFNGATIALKIRNTSAHNLFTGIFDQYLKALAKAVEQARTYLDQTLSDFPEHTPHYGLYLSFLKLFRYAQDRQNQFSKRHLDLYYKEILQLKNKNADPDKVHLTFELSKGVENHLIKKDTIFKAGKDVDNLEIYYALTADLVLNRGLVKSLKSTFVHRNLGSNTLKLLANPVANSEDGQGGKLRSSDKRWKPFGDANSQNATVGFVVASTYLYLTEGTRTITFTFYAPEGDPITFHTSDIVNRFSLQLSGEKGWVDVPVDPDKIAVHTSREYFTITVVLDGGEPPIVQYSNKLHQHNFATTLPVAKFILNEALATENLWNFSVARIGIDIDVKGMKDLAVQNDAGTLNPSKPFDLFGTAPHIGASFILGSKEIFIKTLRPDDNVKATINLTWDNFSELNRIESDEKHKVSIHHLEDAVWKPTKTNLKLFEDHKADVGFVAPNNMLEVAGAQPMFSMMQGVSEMNLAIGSAFGPAIYTPVYFLNFIKPTSKISVNIPPLDVAEDFTKNEPYSVRSSWGFLKMVLNTDFGHSTYALRLAKAAKDAKITTVQSESDPAKSTTTIKIDDVEEPYTPKVKEITLDYSAETTIDFESGKAGTFIHLMPFGSKDVTSTLNRTLLPEAINEGELFIGVDTVKTDQVLSILFQVAEGSADPLSVKQEITWYYLQDNDTWAEFKKEDITDDTNDLTQSGIIRFSISDKATQANTLMSDQLHWLKATVSQNTSAVCMLIEVTAQAATAQFKDFKNSGNYFKNSLVAGTISKPVISEAAVKKIKQPYASFGGKAKESDNHFYTRVSERLRHKNRAIPVWDYERIVLEAYPQLYKVKCINHTQVLEKTSGTQTYYVDNELKPGYVLLVAIPDLQNQNAYDPLRPYTSLGLLTEIKKHLFKYISPHVNLDVRNPRFEEIQMEFKIKFITDDNDFYKKQLKEEIEQYMAPWAYDPQTDIDFGGKISKSSLIDFIEERPYVDYLSCVKMYQIVEGVKSGDVDEALATSARSVFVSVKANDELNAHKISFITDKCDC